MSRFYSFKCLDPAGREVSYWRGDAKNSVCLKRDQTDLFHPKDVRHDDIILVPASGGSTELKVVEIAYADTNEWTTVPRPKVIKVPTTVTSKKKVQSKPTPKQQHIEFAFEGPLGMGLTVPAESLVAQFRDGAATYVKANTALKGAVIWIPEWKQYGIVKAWYGFTD